MALDLFPPSPSSQLCLSFPTPWPTPGSLAELLGLCAPDQVCKMILHFLFKGLGQEKGEKRLFKPALPALRLAEVLSPLPQSQLCSLPRCWCAGLVPAGMLQEGIPASPLSCCFLPLLPPSCPCSPRGDALSPSFPWQFNTRPLPKHFCGMTQSRMENLAQEHQGIIQLCCDGKASGTFPSLVLPNMRPIPWPGWTLEHPGTVKVNLPRAGNGMTFNDPSDPNHSMALRS